MPKTPAPPVPCDASRRREVIAAALALGVPEDYGRARRLSIVREPRALEPIGKDIHERVQWDRAHTGRRRLSGRPLKVLNAVADYSRNLVRDCHCVTSFW